MDDFLKLPLPERRLYFEQAGSVLGHLPTVVEKDFWVCWTLRELFRLRGWGTHLLFKGGTSLSKAWQLIRRFSEDIDIVVDREFLGFPGDHSLGAKQLKKLRRVCHERVRGELRDLLEQRIKETLGAGAGELTGDPATPGEPTLLFAYPSAFDRSAGYLVPLVKIEFGARSDMWPSSEVTVRTFLAEGLPHVVDQTAIPVRVLAAERTFFEKAMLLHEERFRPPEKVRKSRMARHYYDLWCMIGAGVGSKAASDLSLFESVVSHRKVFFAQSWVDYDDLKRGTLRLIPRPDQLASWEKDYREMEIFFGGEAPPSWTDLIEVVRRFEDEFNGVR